VPDDVASAPASAEVTDSGLASRVLQPGTGTEHPCWFAGLATVSKIFWDPNTSFLADDHEL
jgi:hypothetical protein